jgi:hypothetical protein
VRHIEVYKGSKKMRHKLRKTDLYLTVLQHEKIKSDANSRGITFSELFRKIIDLYYEEKIKSDERK